MKKLFNLLILFTIMGCGIDGPPIPPEDNASLTNPIIILPSDNNINT
jgi:predicted small lipoprotein YifL